MVRARLASCGPDDIKPSLKVALRTSIIAALERSNGAEPDVEIRLSLRTDLRVRATAGTHDPVVGRGLRRHRHSRRRSRSLGRPDDGDDVFATRVRPVDNTIACGHSVPRERFEDLDHHFQADGRFVLDAWLVWGSGFHGPSRYTTTDRRGGCE